MGVGIVGSAPIVRRMLLEQGPDVGRTFSLQGIHHSRGGRIEIHHVDFALANAIGGTVILRPWNTRGEEFGIRHMLPMFSTVAIGGAMQHHLRVMLLQPRQGMAKQLTGNALLLQRRMHGNVGHGPSMGVVLPIELLDFRQRQNGAQWMAVIRTRAVSVASASK